MKTLTIATLLSLALAGCSSEPDPEYVFVCPEGWQVEWVQERLAGEFPRCMSPDRSQMTEGEWRELP